MEINIKKLVIIGITILMLINLVHAIELNPFANKKIYEDAVKEDMDNYLKVDFNSDYGVIRISKTFFWIETDKIAEYSLIKNTPECLINCEAEGKAILYNEERLFDDLDFYNRFGSSLFPKDAIVLIEKNEGYTEGIPKYTQVCNQEKNLTETCTSVLEGYDYVNKTRKVWDQYNGEVLPAGKYKWKIKANKKPLADMDFIFTAQGVELSEWTWWNGNWRYKREINITGGNNNLTIIFIDNATNMNADFSDIRFLDEAQTTELNYHIQKYTASSNATVRIETNGETHFYLYYGNAGASTTSNASAVYMGAKYVYYMDEGTGTNVQEYVTGNNITLAGSTTSWKSARISTGVNFTNQGTGTSLYNITGNLLGDGDRTFTWWGAMDLVPLSDSEFFIAMGDNAVNKELSFGVDSTTDNWYIQNRNSNPTSTGDASTNFAFFVLIHNSTGDTLFVNRTELIVDTDTLNTGSSKFMIGHDAVGTETQYLNGYMDEVIVYDRDLTFTEISKLYTYDNSSYVIGTEQGSEGITIALDRPTDNSDLSSASVFFNATLSPDNVNLTNATLYIGNITDYQALSGNVTFNINWSETLNDGAYSWNITACYLGDSGGGCVDSVTYSLEIDTTAPTVSQANNITNLTAFSLPIVSSWNYTVTDTHINTCFYHTSDSVTNITVTCNTSTILTNWSSGGSKTLTYCANDTFGNEACLTGNLTVISIAYAQADDKDPVGEGDSVIYTLQLNVTGATMPSSKAVLIANNTAYSPTTTAHSNYYDFSYSLPIPNGWGNSTGNLIEWYWNYSISGFTTNMSTSTTNTTIYSVDIDDCSTYGDVILNLSLKDEELNSLINTTAHPSNIEVDINLSKGGYSWAYSNQWDNNQTVLVCVPDGLLDNSNYSVNLTMGYNADDFVNEFYFLDMGILSNSSTYNSLTSKVIDLMDLAAADSTSFLFNYFDEDGLVVGDIIVHVFRKYIGEGVFREIERSKQNDNGDTVVHLVEEDVIYYFVISQYGTILFTSNTYTALCQATPCEIQLEESKGFQEFTKDWDLIDNGGYSLTSNSVTRIVNLSYSLTSASKMNLTVYALQSDGSYSSVGSSEETGTVGSIAVTVPTVSGNTTFFASVYQDDVFIRSSWVNFQDDARLYLGTTLSLILAVLIILVLGLSAISEGSLSIIFVILGLIVTMVFGLVNYRVNTGYAILVYLIVAGGILLWKLTKKTR